MTLRASRSPMPRLPARVVTSLALAVLAAGCETASARLVAGELRSAGTALQRPLRAAGDAARRLDQVAADVGRLTASEWRRVPRILRTDLLAPTGRIAAAIDDGLGLIEGARRDAVRLAETAAPSILAGGRRRFDDLGSALRRSGAVLGLDRQILPDRSDWERRTDPDDLRPPASLGERLLRRVLR